MTFEEMLKKYAQLIVHHGMNVQPQQDVYITTEVIHRDFATLLVEEAYKSGARCVIVDIVDPRHLRLRLLETKNHTDLSYVPSFIPYKYDAMIPEHAASVRLLGSEEPEILADLDPEKVNELQLSIRKTLKNYYKEAVGHSKVQWTLAALPTPKWAKKVFPHLSDLAACEALWKDIFHICRADQENCLEIWEKHNARLQKRAELLTALGIEYLHFKGPGTELRVGLSKHAVFRGGASKSPRGALFEPNIPTEEVFTTPDYRKTEGIVKTTRPFMLHSKKIVGLEMEFKQGEIVRFKADEGEAMFGEYIASDIGSKRLGEVALVGIDSPIYQTGRIYEETLFDENAACHIAIGFAYHFCIRDSEKMSADDLENIGCNTSHIHSDMMISSSEVNVIAECYNGQTIPLIQKGEWVNAFS